MFQTFDYSVDYLELGHQFAENMLDRCQWFPAVTEQQNYRIQIGDNWYAFHRRVRQLDQTRHLAIVLAHLDPSDFSFAMDC